MKQVDINETIGTFSFSVQSETSQQVKLFGIFSETRWQIGNFSYVLLSYQSNKWWIGACGQIK